MTNEASSIRVLHVDDDSEFAATTAEYLEGTDDRFEVATATSGAAGVSYLRDHEVDCVVSDQEMPGMDGLEFLDAVRDEYPDLPFVLFTGKGSEEIASEAISAGVSDYLRKGTGTERFELLANRIDNAVAGYRAQRAAEQAQERLDQLAENVRDVLWIYDEDWSTVEFVNSAYEEVWGQSTDALSENPELFVEATHPEDRERVQSAMERVSAGEPVDIEIRVGGDEQEATADATRDGYRWAWVQAEPIIEDGDVVRIVGFTRDVTERKERERELEQYETIVTAIPDEVYTVDTEGNLTSIIPPTDGELTTTGYDPDDLVGEHVSMIMDDEDIQRGERLIRDLLSDPDRERGSFEMEIVTKSGERIPNENHIALLETDDGEFRGTVGVLRDITERKRRDRELRRQNERLEEFVGVVSHDLRNPLNVAQSRVELARLECDSDHLDQAGSAHERMKTLIDDLLTLAREGETVRDLEPVALADTVEACWNTVATGNAALQVETDLTLRADRSRLQQLLENLFRNAVEHSSTSQTESQRDPDDAVEHSSTSDQSSADTANPCVTVAVGDFDGDERGFFVADDGPGIPPEERDRVFESGYSTAAEGTGFGLPIVQEIAEAHDWSVTVCESETGGTRFEISGVETGD